MRIVAENDDCAVEREVSLFSALLARRQLPNNLLFLQKQIHQFLFLSYYYYYKVQPLREQVTTATISCALSIEERNELLTIALHSLNSNIHISGVSIFKRLLVCCS